MFGVLWKSHTALCRLAHLCVTGPRCHSVCANTSMCVAFTLHPTCLLMGLLGPDTPGAHRLVREADVEAAE